MKIFLKVILILTILLSLATGLFKILQQEADIQLFKVLGFTALHTTIFGAIQIIGGILIIFKPYRRIGGTIMFITFSLASWVVFLNQMWIFGLVSLLFIAMAAIVINYNKLEKG